MLLSHKATAGIATRAEGSFTNCGLESNDFELAYNCRGPACSGLDGSFLDVTCHQDGRSRLICSNDSKCQPGTSSYQSNFTFSQNEPDPWSPVMENEPDTWVPQSQHIMVANCAKFSLTSDGTKQGTRVDDKGLADSCPVEGISAETPNARKTSLSTPTRRPITVGTQGAIIFAGTGSRRTIPTASFLLALTLMWALVLPGALASALNSRDDIDSGSHNDHVRETSDKAKAFAEGFRANIAQKAGNQDVNGEAFASNLVANIISSVCGSYFQGSTPGSFTPEVVKECVSSVYGDQLLSQPGRRFLAVFGASLLCDYLVSQIYPDGQGFLADGCEGLQDLVNEARSSSPLSVLHESVTSLLPETGTRISGIQSVRLQSSNVQAPFQTTLTSTRIESSAPKVETTSLNTTLFGSVSSTYLLLDSTRMGFPLKSLVSSASPSKTMPSMAVPPIKPTDLIEYLHRPSWIVLLLEHSSNLATSEGLESTSARAYLHEAGASSYPSTSNEIGIAPPTSVTSAAFPAILPQPLQTGLTLNPPKLQFTPAEALSIPIYTVSQALTMGFSTEHMASASSPMDYAGDSIAEIVLETPSTRSEMLQAPGTVLLSRLESDQLSQEPTTIGSLNLDHGEIPTPTFKAQPAPENAPFLTTDSQKLSQGRSWSMYNAVTTTLAPTLFSDIDKSSPSMSPLANPAGFLNIPPKIDNPSPNSIQTTSASTKVLIVITTLTEIVISAGSTELSWASSALVSPEGFVDLSTESWYGDLPPSASQFSLSSANPQPSNTSSAPFADHIHTASLLNTFISANRTQVPYVANDSMPALAFNVSAEVSSTFKSSIMSAATSISELHPPLFTNSSSSSQPLSRTAATQFAPLVSSLSLRSTDRWASFMLSVGRNSPPNSMFPMTPITAPSATNLGSMYPPSSSMTIEPIDNQGLGTEAYITIPVTTIHSTSIITSTTIATSIDEVLVMPCSGKFKNSTFCLGSGCVNLKTDKAHCGACNQVCEHGCHQGVCVCPDLARLEENSECVNMPGLGACVTGYTRNIYKVCSPVRTTTLLGSSTPTWTRPAAIEVAVPSFALLASNKAQTVSALAFSTQVPNLGSILCPPGLPDVCNGGCFNTKTEHNHCGQCGNFCSGTCIDGRCLVKPTPSRLQLDSSRRTVTITRVLTESPMLSTVSSTSPPVASYIWKGLNGL
ncbi:hypothetical protein SVAN01_10216 [Stagonosporopsis vannaccii]|nr:hypothetical protein SVAN01_10216 [Stagonosporopsis vannaccii]